MRKLLSNLRDLGIQLYMHGEELKASGATEIIDNPELLQEMRAHRDELKIYARRYEDPMPFQHWFMSLEMHKCTNCGRFHPASMWSFVPRDKCEVYSQLVYPQKLTRCIWYKERTYS